MKYSCACNNCGKLFNKCKSHALRAKHNFCSKDCWSKFDDHANKNFFKNIDSEDKAYWLGFVCADGWLDERDQALGIGLSIKDKLHLTKFASIFEVKVNEYRNYAKTRKNNRNVRCLVYSKSVYADLFKMGIEPRKTFKDSIKVFEYIKPELENHFIRGWFDGDGSIYNEKTTSPRMSFVGTELCLNKIRDIFVRHTNCTKVKVHKHKSIFSICWSGKDQLIANQKWLYKNSNTFLERKKERFERVIL